MALKTATKGVVTCGAEDLLELGHDSDYEKSDSAMAKAKCVVAVSFAQPVTSRGIKFSESCAIHSTHVSYYSITS